VRLLFDQNLSPRLLALLADLYGGSTHVRNEGLETADDDTVWEYAARHGVAIVLNRASGGLAWVAVRFVKTAHEPLDIRRRPAPPHDNRPEVKGRCRDDRIRKPNSPEVVMQVGPTSAMDRVA
jgi:hypothetical protein